jgi:hypothetical protein
MQPSRVRVLGTLRSAAHLEQAIQKIELTAYGHAIGGVLLEAILAHQP